MNEPIVHGVFIFFLHLLIMNYFSDINFIKCGEFKFYSVNNTRRFDGYYGIQYTHSGELVLQLDRRAPLHMKEPCFFVSGPGPLIRYAPPPGQTRHHLFLCFQGERVQRWIDGGLLPAVGTVQQVKRPEEFLASLRRIKELISQIGGRGHDRAVIETEMLLLNCRTNSAPRHGSLLYRHKLQQLADEIRENPSKKIDFEREAARMGSSYSHFRLTFRELFGCPPNRYQLECRLNLAAELLLESDLQIRDIAQICGFSNEFYFSRIFAKHRLLPPSEFRR